MSRVVIKIAGESGMGIESSGMIVMKALKKMGFWIYGEREFPSLIKGGRANIQINFSQKRIYGMSGNIDISVAVDREGLLDSLETTKNGGIIINGFERWNKVVKNLDSIASEKNLQVIHLPAREIALTSGGNIIMVNVVLLGYLWKILGLELESLHDQINHQFASKKDLLPVNLACSRAGFDFEPENGHPNFETKVEIDNLNATEEKMLIDGNSSLVLGAVSAGVRTYFGYPMSPSSSILTYIAEIADEYGILVKQAEDEITAVQMTLGAMHMGTRSLTSTSGGGFDLMTETISLSAMTETPLVSIIAQRPGPATGLPTWTGQADLNLAIHAGHGEFTKLVVGGSDPESCYYLIQKTFNLAEKYQIPAIILTEASIGMSYSTVPQFDQNIPVERYLEESNPELKQENRFEITETGVSKRWIPGSSEAVYFANGDEHWSGGELTEEADKAQQMIQKRNYKEKFLLEDLPEPELFGKTEAKITIVGWGSTKKAVLDSLEILNSRGIEINYLHYEFLWPVKTKNIKSIFEKGNNLILIEGNYEGQFGTILEQKAGVKFSKKLLKYNGRPVVLEDVVGLFD